MSRVSQEPDVVEVHDPRMLQLVEREVRAFGPWISSLQIGEEPNNPDPDTGGDGASPNVLGAVVEAAWPLLAPGGTLVLAGSLLDGTLADETRRDRPTAAARETDELVDTLDGAVVTRLPVDGGVTLVTRR